MDTSKLSERSSATEGYQNVDAAVNGLILEQDRKGAVAFLKENPLMTGEFCATVVERYKPTDRFTPALELSFVIEEFLGLEKPNY